MKKMMILTLAVLGMVLGSFALVQPVKAQGGPCGPVIQSGDCQIQECGDCIYHECPAGNFIRCYEGG
ncbi:hypothetical protein [Algoriphagus algorifonticola]|uniref:hypothetical protein n=1 Tax=Algoriphagus algorifonticola TaxID=2593007 RepID=UPI00119DC697|nr:hypothetical protein [Algoriphagus algorifonticola]